MLVVFSPIFVVDTEIIFRHNFVAPLIKNSINYIYRKQSYLHRKYKDFQFSILKRLQKKKYMIQDAFEEMCEKWWLVHLVSRLALNGRINQAQIHDLCEINYCNKI